MELKTQIERFIVEDVLADGRDRLEPGEPLVGMGGLLDSLGLLRLIQFVEEQFQIRVGDGDVGEENFGSLERLVAFVARKQAEGREQ
ncbi:phosphopantetheine-binding protein [Limisphaera sp. VF-2]|uniref:phosphopantetheine-binding protein n=1 Tax=Limisphaera sp. VF-2 TaxID=3400418 RepID=UPI0030B6D899